MYKEISRDEPEIIKWVKAQGFKVFEKKDFDLNIIGIRNLSSTKANLFDDEIHILYKERGFWVDEWGEATTDPSTYYLKNENYRPNDGVAILCHPQQILGGYVLGPHGQTGYTALVNRGRNPTKVWRDGNRDNILDWDTSSNWNGQVYEGYFGINIHRASTRGNDGVTRDVSVWSAGCQVWADVRDFHRMLELCQKQIDLLGYESFTYTLIGR